MKKWITGAVILLRNKLHRFCRTAPREQCGSLIQRKEVLGEKIYAALDGMGMDRVQVRKRSAEG